MSLLIMFFRETEMSLVGKIGKLILWVYMVKRSWPVSIAYRKPAVIILSFVPPGFIPLMGNFVKTMRQLTADKDTLKVVFDQVGTPTYAGDLASVIYQVIEENQLYKEGIYHFSNEGVCAWYDFAKEICDLSGNVCDIQPCHSDEFPSKVKRPHFSVLDKTKVKSTFGITVPYWKDSLQKCIHELKQQSAY